MVVVKIMVVAVVMAAMMVERCVVGAPADALVLEHPHWPTGEDEGPDGRVRVGRTHHPAVPWPSPRLLRRDETGADPHRLCSKRQRRRQTPPVKNAASADNRDRGAGPAQTRVKRPKNFSQ